MHNTCQKQTRCKATFLNIRAAEIACREMQNMIETHTHCLTAHTHTLTWCAALYCAKNGCWNWHIGKMQKLVPNYGQNRNVLEKMVQTKMRSTCQNVYQPPPFSHIYLYHWMVQVYIYIYIYIYSE